MHKWLFSWTSFVFHAYKSQRFDQRTAVTHCVIPTRVLLIKFNLSFFCSNKQILLQDCNCEHNTVTLATLKWAAWWNHQTKAGGTPTSGGGFMQSHSSSSYPHICLFFSQPPPPLTPLLPTPVTPCCSGLCLNVCTREWRAEAAVQTV